MRRETIYHPDMLDTAFGDGEKSPKLSHITVEHSDPLDFSPNPIIQKLIEAGWELHTTFSQFWVAMPRNSLMLGTPFVFQERHEFEIRVEGIFFLRFRFEESERIFLTLFAIDHGMQGKGLGKVWFPRVTEALFRAGVKFMWGKVQPPFQRGAWPMNQKRLIRFYEKQGFLNLGDERISKFSPYKALKDAGGDSPNNDATETRSASEMATIS